MGFLRFFTIERQAILFVLSFIGIFGFHYMWGFAGSWFPILIVLILVIKHLLIGTVNAAAMKMQMGDFDGAESILKYTLKPSWLKFGFHGAYYMMKSKIAMLRKDYKEGERLSMIALELDLQEDMKASIYLDLIGISAQRKNQAKAKEYLQKAKKLNVTQPMIKEKIKEVEDMLKGRHQTQKKMMGKKAQRSMMQGGFMKRGGGRRK